MQEYLHIISIAEFSKAKSHYGYDLSSSEDTTGKASKKALFQGFFFSAEYMKCKADSVIEEMQQIFNIGGKHFQSICPLQSK